MDTTNILFICGGAFVGLESIIERRIGQKALGFGALVPESARARRDATLDRQQPTDLIRYGLIPEFVGRLPVVATLDNLGEAELIRIMTEPRNAIVKQYQLLLRAEGVECRFTDDALGEIAAEAARRDLGARGLRMIIENLMLDLMYDCPRANRCARWWSPGNSSPDAPIRSRFSPRKPADPRPRASAAPAAYPFSAKSPRHAERARRPRPLHDQRRGPDRLSAAGTPRGGVHRALECREVEPAEPARRRAGPRPGLEAARPHPHGQLLRDPGQPPLVDLPGYGFARVPESLRAGWEALVLAYLTARESLVLNLLLVDPRRDPWRTTGGRSSCSATPAARWRWWPPSWTGCGAGKQRCGSASSSRPTATGARCR